VLGGRGRRGLSDPASSAVNLGIRMVCRHLMYLDEDTASLAPQVPQTGRLSHNSFCDGGIVAWGGPIASARDWKPMHSTRDETCFACDAVVAGSLLESVLSVNSELLVQVQLLSLAKCVSGPERIARGVAA